MLKSLHIQQFVIIDRLDLDFQSGLTILTGETGAGKSILLDATGLMLGEPADYEAIRQGSDKSIIEAIFTPPAEHPVWKFLNDNKLSEASSGEFKVHRTMRLSGTEEIQVNGRPIDVELLKKLGSYLVEIHGQFANQGLLDPANQLTLLDLSGGFPPEVFTNVSGALREVRRLTQALEDENLFQARHRKEAPKLEDLGRRFEQIGMKKGFTEEALNEYARLLTAKETSEAFQNILGQLIAANGVVMGLASAHHILTSNPNLEVDKVADLTTFLSTALDNTRAAVKEMRRIAPEYDIDTAPIAHYAKIINEMETITKENKIEFEKLDDFFEEVMGKLNRLRAGRETVAKMHDDLIKAKNDYRHHAHILHEKRVIAGQALSAEITAELAPLKLMKAEFQVVVEEQANMPWTPLGLDKVTFTARMNPGMPFSPVAETASGGELARLILALKVVVQRVQTIPTLIFDEVDTGIGGAAAAAVGERLALLAENTQVLVITHSPQVASRGDAHLHVSKKTDGVTTTSVVNKLTDDQRIDEISRMLAGDQITEESKAAARSLISEARNASTARRTKPAVAVDAAPAALEEGTQDPEAPTTQIS
jgi:DNA repair protein RecN (Recombination protein N)